MDWSSFQVIAIMAIGLTGGVLGGLLGLGGSVFIIPALTFLLGTNQHLYQAAALIANVFVAVAATNRHRGRGTIRRDIVPAMALATTGAAVAGVLISNLFSPKPLAAVFGVFLCFAAISELIALIRRVPDCATTPDARCPLPLAVGIGLTGGFASGLLGIGGGAIMVPLLRKFGRLPLRQAVASSAAAMIVACAVGALAKNLSIATLTTPDGTPLTMRESLMLAGLLAPLAMVGGTIGATLVYRLPIDATRLVLSILLAFAGVRMILTGLGW
jgi:uncharacterized protein